MDLTARSIILFDGDCNFCNSTINFIIDWDKKNIFSFSSLQSPLGKSILMEYNLPEDCKTIVLISEKRAYLKSTAVLKIASDLAFPLNFLGLLKVIPMKFRDWVYSIISERRKNIVKGMRSCRIPNQSIQRRFL